MTVHNHDQNHDHVFLKHFSQVMVVLSVLTVGLILLAVYLNKFVPAHVNPASEAATIERIRPAGAVFAGSSGAAAQAAAVAAAATAAAGQVAYEGTLDGSVIYGKLCSGCHTAGVGGAPTLERSAWTARLAAGKDTLHNHAINGFTGAGGVMPARGGNPALTDEQVIATVDWMISQLK